MTDVQTQARLDALGRSLALAQDRLKERAAISDDHVKTARDLQIQYDTLRRQVERQELATESEGHHVSALEHAIRMWIDRLTDKAV
ncbi:MAG: hypothetical protein ABI832_13875 [bacterium]